MSDRDEIGDAGWLLALLMTPGIGVVTVNRVALALGEAGIPFRSVVGQSISVLGKGLPSGLEWAVEPLACCASATVDRAVFWHDRVVSSGGQWLVRGAGEYPGMLDEVMGYSAPPLLSVFGDVELLGRDRISIVGSREPSERGRVLAEELAGWCVSGKRMVVSGGAKGIDLAAHRAALDGGGDSCVMIAQGAMTYEGPGWLKGYLESGNAAVVSSFIPDIEWSASGAMGRNRLIAGLGQVVCVVDPGMDSGSHRTAEFALEYDKRTLVYAYDKAESAYPVLMRGGAYPVLNENGVWDVDYMESHWKRGGRVSRKQAELF